MINADVCVYAKTEDSVEGRRYNPSDFPKFSNLTSTTTTLRINLIQDERTFSDRYSRRGNMCLFIKSYQRTLKKKKKKSTQQTISCSWTFFSRALPNIWRMINCDGMGWEWDATTLERISSQIQKLLLKCLSCQYSLCLVPLWESEPRIFTPIL